MIYDIGFVGTGANPDDPDQHGFAMAYRHAMGYEKRSDCRLQTCADIVPENAARFAEEFDIEDQYVYQDYGEMVGAADPDIVSVCVPPDLHAEIVIDCAKEGNLEAIHCEKPMATTWDDCKEMCRVCEEEGVKLTFNHQKRVGPIFRRAKELVDNGKIGRLQRVEWAAENLFDSGTHMFDLTAFYTDQSPVEWVLTGLDYRDENRWFGVHNENQAVCQWRHENGIYGLAATGRASDSVSAHVRLVGDEGTVEIDPDSGPPLRVRNDRTLGWKTVEVGENVWGNRAYATYTGYLRWGYEIAREQVGRKLLGGDANEYGHPSHIDRSIASVVEAVRTDGESPLSWRNALESTEVIFSAWESARRGERVNLPLEIGGNPLEEMVENGELPVSAQIDGIADTYEGDSGDSVANGDAVIQGDVEGNDTQADGTPSQQPIETEEADS